MLSYMRVSVEIQQEINANREVWGQGVCLDQPCSAVLPENDFLAMQDWDTRCGHAFPPRKRQQELLLGVPAQAQMHTGCLRAC